MKNISTFQIVLIGVFGLCIVGAITIFALARTDTSKTLPAITIWGTVPAVDFMKTVGDVNLVLPSESRLTINYVQKTEQEFDQALIEALASGTGPDAILFPHTSLVRQQDKITAIPPGSYSPRAFKDTFVDEASLYETAAGVLALPLSIDPLVMYWNKDIFSGLGVATPPKLWDEFFDLVPKFIQKDRAGNLSRAFVSLGEYSNIVNAKEIISALLFQSGTPIVSRLPDGRLNNDLMKSPGGSIGTFAESVMRFYTEFSNPAKTSYTWNRALRDSRTVFAAGDLALYFGFASEYRLIQEKNPNLNFDVAALPQLRDSKVKLNYGKMYGLAIMRSSRNVGGVFQNLLILTGPEFGSRWAEASGLPSARRDLLSARSADPNKEVFAREALISRGWLDPNPARTNQIFKQMVERITSGQDRPGAAVNAAFQEFQVLLQ